MLAAAMGLFYVIDFAGLVGSPTPHDPDEPTWLPLVFGMIFLLGGSAAMIKTAFGRDNPPGGGLPSAAPRWLKLIYHVMVLALVTGMGVLFSWIAFAPGRREFSGSGAIFGELGGRVMFGIGALLIWICVIVIAIDGARRFIADK